MIPTHQTTLPPCRFRTKPTASQTKGGFMCVTPHASKQKKQSNKTMKSLKLCHRLKRTAPLVTKTLVYFSTTSVSMTKTRRRGRNRGLIMSCQFRMSLLILSMQWTRVSFNLIFCRSLRVGRSPFQPQDRKTQLRAQSSKGKHRFFSPRSCLQFT